MNVKEAISRAKTYAQDIFSDEKMSNLGVEEIAREGGYWRITLGLSRPWDNPKAALAMAMVTADDKPANRSYHVFTIADKDGEMVDVRLRER